ncbi:LysE/ArgO family amino acid transporter [Phreatobacter cathodiphilus]|uniref:Amino acid transporter n=1 Tax=Phreatobacter cathodiphilus TaxID=1868589 RepID=A0A2S0NG55_9HYPH|nr:LysE/ArgO family amino acid transporter [Phreatobacter cathodiphilus]AVO46883.1 amino acid transporter [Phreatobacter cathodiphilus]
MDLSASLQAALTGFLLGLGLIVAIGAQNAFVLRQGLMRRHVLLVTTLCALSDAVLILAGVAGLGSLVARSPVLLTVATLGGAAFLLAYGALAARRALRPDGLTAAPPETQDVGRVVAATLAFTFLNPHVYLDTVVLVGSLSARHTGSARAAFAGGAMTASFLWFYGLGFGARLLAPVFARPAAWRVLDGLIACVMVAIALSLLNAWRTG